MYQMRYYEEVITLKATRKTVRHTSVYHHHNPDPNICDCIIILHPTESPAFDQSLRWLEGIEPREVAKRLALCREPLSIHALLFSTYSSGWRKHNRLLGAECGSQVFSILCTFLITQR